MTKTTIYVVQEKRFKKNESISPWAEWLMTYDKAHAVAYAKTLKETGVKSVRLITRTVTYKETITKI